MNWQYNELEDYYIDTDGVRFNFLDDSQRKDRYGYRRCFKIYQAEKYKDDYEVIEQALTPKGYLRKISINLELEYYKAKQRELLSNPEYADIYARQKIGVEPAFGHLKARLGFTRFHVRGIDGVRNKMRLALMAAHFRKLNGKKQRGTNFLNRSLLLFVFLCGAMTFVTASFSMKGDNNEIRICQGQHDWSESRGTN